MRIVVNGRDCEFDGETISYEEAVELAGAECRAVGQPTVTYLTPGTRHGGELCPGANVRVFEGMVINAVDTSRA